MHSCTLAETPRPPIPPHLGSYGRALLVSQDRRHLFLTPGGSHFAHGKGRGGTQIIRQHRNSSTLYIKLPLHDSYLLSHDYKFDKALNSSIAAAVSFLTWTLMCLTRTTFWLKDLLQCGQGKGRSPVWMRWCRARWARSLQIKRHEILFWKFSPIKNNNNFKQSCGFWMIRVRTRILHFKPGKLLIDKF